MNVEEQDRLRVELLVDPGVLCPGPDLSPMKPEYQEMIAGVPYGSQSDYVLAVNFSTQVSGTRAVDVPVWKFRKVLLKGYGSWGKLDLIAAQTPFYYGLSSAEVQGDLSVIDPKPGDTPRIPAASETELVRNMMCRNVMAILSDPQMVLLGDDYETIHSSLSALVAQALISQDEFTEMMALMIGGPVTHAYNLGLVDSPQGGVLAADVQWALRG